MSPREISLTIIVQRGEDDHGWIATGGMTRDFGWGETPYDAVAQFFEEMGNTMSWLKKQEARLAKGLARDLADTEAWVEGRLPSHV